jgi:hypothetical protein
MYKVKERKKYFLLPLPRKKYHLIFIKKNDIIYIERVTKNILIKKIY